ncbi:conserved repeat protein [Parvimonas sp. oral taxon 110 str. F0139]|nr:conserved repeat protein [Parvimonas sp. oral taxon 110 str. F0139]
MKKREIINKLVSMLTIFALLMPIASQVHAANPAKGLEINADHTELDKAVKELKDLGVNPTQTPTEEKGTVKTKVDVDAKVAEVKADYAQQIQQLKKAKEAIEKCNKDTQAYEAEKKKYDEALERYNKAKEQYDKDLEAYNKSMEELKKHNKEDGYLSQPVSQNLKFSSEPQAKMSISGSKVYSQSEFDSTVKSWGHGSGWGYAYFDALNKGLKGTSTPLVAGDSRVILEKGKPVTVTYTNLQKSYMNGVKITKAVFTYTLKSTSPLPNKVPVIIKQDPTATIWYTDFFGNTTIGVNFQLFDENDKPVDLTGGLLSFASLNKGHTPKVLPNYKSSIERVGNFNGELLEINGSSIKNHSGSAYANTSNANKEDGSKYTTGQWDTETSQLSWYGAIVGRAKGKTVNYEMSSNYCGNIWFALNSKIKAKGVPIKPMEPTKPTPPTEPKCPKVEAKYHYNVFFYQPPVEKKVLNQSDSDINNKTVATNSVVKFVLNVANLPAGHEKLESLSFKDKLPSGYEVDLDGTKQASSNYDVNYDKDTNEITFTAKAEYLNTINADLNKEIKISAPIITGKVTKEGTKYDNDFDLTINNDYTVKSKPVTVYTPTEPKKDVFKGSDTTSIDGKIVEAGDELRYDITYKNTTGTKQTVTITDKIPQYTKFVSADNDGVDNGGVITWVKEVENGDSLTVSFKVKVNDDVNGNPIDNISHVKDGFNETDTNKTHNPTSTKPVKDVFDSKDDKTSIDGNEVKAGQELLYKVTYKNTTGTKQTVTITDKIPEHTTFVSADNDGVDNGGTIKWVKDVENGDSLTVTFKVKVDENVNGEKILNKAKVVDGHNDYDTNETTNPTPTKPVKNVFDSKDDKTSIDGNEVKAGQELLYKVTYKNTTGKEQTVTITDKIPEHTTYVEGSADNNGVFKDGKITWTKEKVANGDTFEVTFRVKVAENVNGEKILNKANVVEGKNSYDTNETTNPTPTKPVKDVFDSKDDKASIDGKEVKAGQELLYKVTYTNTTGKEQKVTITDKIPEHTTYVENSADNNGVFKDGTITWTKEKVADGETFEVTFKVKVNDNVNGEKILNKANVVDGNNNFDTNETTNPTPTKPVKDVFEPQNDRISIDGQVVKGEQELLYKVTYTNTTGKEQRVTITDKIPEHTTYVENSADNNGSFKDGTITWTKEKVANGETFEVTFKVKVKADVNGEKIVNKANVVDGNNKYDTNETTNPTSTKPVKDVFAPSDNKTSIDGNEVKAGQELLYKVTYKNTTGKEQTVTITDKIPEHTTYVEGSADNNGSFKDGKITWTKEKVADGETFEVTFKVKVNDNVNGEKILNKANVVDGNNDYDTNETTNPTPTKPVKDVVSPSDDKTSIDGNEVKAGQELLYKITYTNTTGKKQTVTITDKIPEHTTFVSADNGGKENAGTIKWVKDVENGDSLTVTFKVKVNDNVNGEKILNKANVVDGNNSYDTNETTNPTPTKPVKDVFAPSDNKTSIDGNEVKAGQELLYKVTYKNTTGKEQTVTITDKIPEHTTYVEGSADNNGSFKDGTITWTKEKVADGETFEVTFKVKVDDNVNGEKILNKANVVDGNNNFDTNETTNPTPTKPVKDVFAPSDNKTSIDGNEVKAGQELLYKITYKNTTGKEQTVTITDKIPEHTTFVSADNDGVYKDGTITWTKEKVADGKTFEVTFKVKVNDNVNGEKILNKANVVDGNNDYDTNETTNPTPTKPVKDVFDSKDDKTSIDGNEVKAGQELLYKITYKNTTGKDQKVTITDKIPEHTTFVSADNDGVYKDGTITWTKEKVADREVFEVTFKVKVNDNVNGEKILNKANVVDGNNNFDTNETTNPTPTKPVKDVFAPSDNKTSIDGNEVKAGQELLYKITYKNTTGKDQKVTITDKIPEHTTFVSADNDGVYKDGTITWTKEKVADGETFEVTFKVKVNDDVNGEKILNKANVVDGNNNFDTNETTNPTPTKPVKDVFEPQNDRVSIDGQVVKAGQELLYKVTYTNTTGKDQKVVIKDRIPEHTTYVENSADNNGIYKDGEITWTKEKVANGETFEVTFKVKVDDNVNGEKILNKANVVDGSNNFDTNETTNPTSTKPVKDVFDSKDDKTSIDGNEVKAGQELLYKITYKNTTGSKQTVTITDKIPEHTKFVSADNDGKEKDGTIKWVKEVEDGETLTVSFKVKVDDNVNGEKIVNKANVVDGNNNYDTNETTNPTPTKPVKDVFDSKDDKTSIDGKGVKAGQELLYKVTYKNTTGKEQKVVIKDRIPEHTTYVEGSADNNGVYKDGEITWTKEKVADGETFEVTFKVKVNANVNGEKIVNKANVVDGNNSYETNETTNPTPLRPRPQVPKTGYGVNTGLYTVLLGLSAGALGGMKIRYRRKRKK